MRFSDYIIEEINIESIIRHLERNAPKFIREIKGAHRFPVRLIKSTVAGKGSNLITRDVRKNRKPLDTPLKIHEYVDSWFYKKYKLRPRSQGLFTWAVDKYDIKTISIGQPANYFVFPHGNYTAIGSTKVRDLYELVGDKIHMEQVTDSRLHEDLDKFLLSLNYTTSVRDLFRAYDRIEVAFLCNRYTMLKASSLTWSYVENLMK